MLPKGVTDAGRVYGVACPGEGFPCQGFIWRNGTWSIVNYPGAPVTTIEAMHPTNGKLWGNYLDTNGRSHAFTATPK
jgi:hypothetical protein